MKGLAKLYEEWSGCTKCGLHETRKNLVFGEGPQNAKIMFIGLAPGGKEDEEGLPFIGESGGFLKKILMKKAKLKPEDVFFTNLVCCRPFVLDDRGQPKDRDPTVSEIAACMPRLLETIYIVDPIWIVCLGALAAGTLAKKKGFPITKKRGEMLPQYSIHVPGKYLAEIVYPMQPVLHPAYLLRNPDIGRGGWIEQTINDLEKVRKDRDFYNA